CTLIDAVGIDIIHRVSKILYGAFGERMKPPPFLASLVAEGRLGQKTGKGFYIYEDGGKKKIEDPLIASKSAQKKRDSVLTDEVVQKRLAYLMVNEGTRCMEEGLVRDVSEIDIGMIFGTGFAPFRGGVLRYADSVGAESIVADLELFSRNYGQRFEPCSFLQQLAVGKKKFYKD
ncbi:MAG: fatty acid oxidation complex subunit alpha FadJ, partial [Deltaproteobacteria bacterium]|nr:fatty acid oxidation complex subunit alpha FadJ [Deltaproteobacteria bacterium]